MAIVHITIELSSSPDDDYLTRATLNGVVLADGTAPMIVSARTLLAKGCDPMTRVRFERGGRHVGQHKVGPLAAMEIAEEKRARRRQEQPQRQERPARPFRDDRPLPPAKADRRAPRRERSERRHDAEAAYA